MSDTHNVAPGGGAEPVVSTPATTPVTTPATTPPSNEPFTPRDAARVLNQRRIEKARESARANPNFVPGPDDDDVVQVVEEARQRSAQADDTAPETAPGDEQTRQQTDPAEESPIELPRSWTREQREQWNALPRDIQEQISTREQERDREIRRVQNDTAQMRQALQAEMQAVAQQRQQYEQLVPAVEFTLQQQLAGEFPDIQSMADVTKMAAEDWPRYAKWDAAQKQLQASRVEREQAQHRQAHEYAQQWNMFAAQQDQLFTEKHPEIVKDKAKAAKVGTDAVTRLREHGFEDQEIAALWNGQVSLSLRDARAQQLVLDSIELAEIKAKSKAAVARAVPPVQRPGVSRPRNAGTEALQALSEKLNQTGSAKDAARLIAARRAASARR